MIWQLGLPTFFATFTFSKGLWDPFIKILHTLHAWRLNDLPNKMEDFWSIHITKLIQIDPITCARYYNHRTSCFLKLIPKDHFLFGYISEFLVTKFQNCGNEHDHGLLWIKDASMYGVHINEKIENFVNMFIFCDMSLLPNPLQNA